ncbi:MAG: hypothetical protein ACI379_13470 [Nocardioides sp.]|uniref:hypothetical protein n=1 Tax=Nocardioides sp. TaxID=35761 RepID=UPI003F0B7C75
MPETGPEQPADAQPLLGAPDVVETPERPAYGVHLERTSESLDEVRALHHRAASYVGLPTLLNDLKWPLRRSPVLPRLIGRRVHRAWSFNSYDERDHEWYPQGIATAHDAPDRSVVPDDRRIVVTTWYSKGTDGVQRGSRLTFVDLDRRRYRHVLLVVPTFDEDGQLVLEPLNVHAGGLVWAGQWLHIAATGRGFASAHVDDLMRVAGSDGSISEFGVRPHGIASYGHRWVLPVRSMHRAVTDKGHDRLRYSFLGLDAGAEPPAIVAGEYASKPDTTTRLARFDLDPQSWQLAADDHGISRPMNVDGGGVLRMQGAAVARGRLHVSTSNGQWGPGSIWTGRPGDLTSHRWALPMGPEDLTYTPRSDLLWTVTEHPRRRWIVSMRRSDFD